MGDGGNFILGHWPKVRIAALGSTSASGGIWVVSVGQSRRRLPCVTADLAESSLVKRRGWYRAYIST